LRSDRIPQRVAHLHDVVAVEDAVGHRGGFWLVWYDPLGVPATMTNGILERNDVAQMGNALRNAV